MAIRVKLLSGPYAGQTWPIAPETVPTAFLTQFLEQGWAWEIEFSDASPEEEDAWRLADFQCRIVRAIGSGLPVSFLGIVYQVDDTDNMEERRDIGDAIETALHASKQNVTIEYDDGRGVSIAPLGLMQ